MGNVIGNLTQGELIMVVGRLLGKIGEKVDAGDFKDGAQLSEIFDLVQGFATDVLSEYNDEPAPEE
jgi:hypothetical protein